jgi:aminocarboxymuconate-semialdehyde decarboxylase
MTPAPHVIDIHAHAVLEAGFEQAGRYGPELGIGDDGVPFFRVGSYTMAGMAYRGSVFTDVGRRLELMDRAGIHEQLLSPNPLTFFHGIDAADAVRYCRVHNEAMAELVAAHPGRLLGAAALPMQDVDAATSELERAVKDLGLVAPYVGTDFGFELDDARLDDFYRTLVALDVPLFLHPASSGGEGAPDDRRLRRFDLSLLLGYAYDETLAVSALVFGGVLDRHPDLDICVSHGGGAMPFLIERFQFACNSRRWVPEHLRDGGFERALRRLWFDSHVDGHHAREALVRMVGLERMVYGTNFGGWDSAHGEASDTAFMDAIDGNAERLLRHRPAADAGASSTSGPTGHPQTEDDR